MDSDPLIEIRRLMAEAYDMTHVRIAELEAECVRLIAKAEAYTIALDDADARIAELDAIVERTEARPQP